MHMCVRQCATIRICKMLYVCYTCETGGATRLCYATTLHHMYIHTHMYTYLCVHIYICMYTWDGYDNILLHSNNTITWPYVAINNGGYSTQIIWIGFVQYILKFGKSFVNNSSFVGAVPSVLPLLFHFIFYFYIFDVIYVF